MKRYLQTCSLLVLFFLSCKKDSPQQPGNIVGTWQWQVTYSTGVVGIFNPRNTGMDVMLSFKNDGNYTIATTVQNKTTTDSGTYKLDLTKNQQANLYISRIHYSNARIQDSIAYYSITGNTDSLSFNPSLTGVAGNYSIIYTKLYLYQ